MPAPLPLCPTEQIRQLPIEEVIRLDAFWRTEFRRIQIDVAMSRLALAAFPMPGADRSRIELLLDYLARDQELAYDRFSLYTAEIARRRSVQPVLVVELDEAAPVWIGA
jgi:hypothetical protein